MLRSVAVFAGSASGTSPAYARAAAELGRELGRRGVAIVYGGARCGLMGAVADAALEAGGEVTGVIPRALVDRELAHRGLTRLEVVDGMHARKARMAELAEGFITLPGGAGTLDELFEAWTWQQLGLRPHPVALLDVDGYWAPLRAMIDASVDAGFLGAASRDALIVAGTAIELIAALERWDGTGTRWEPRS